LSSASGNRRASAVSRGSPDLTRTGADHSVFKRTAPFREPRRSQGIARSRSMAQIHEAQQKEVLPHPRLDAAVRHTAREHKVNGFPVQR
jgi:hypothetical protein